MPIVSHPAPTFAIPAVSLKSPEPQTAALADYSGQWLLLFFYPRDFSLVCPTELTSLSARSVDFEQRNCQILGVSVDSTESHIEWLNTPASAGGLGPLQFPLASDYCGGVAKAYGVWLPDKGISARGLFLIDPQGILQYSVVHNLSVGRSVDEVLRLLDAMQSGGLCPANWTTADGNIDPEKALQPGTVLGHYRIQKLLGVGSFGTVFAGWDLRLERDVALKVLKRNAAESRDAILHEARAAAPLTHPNICRIYAVEAEDGLPVIAMEHIDGLPLNDLIAAGLSVESKLRLAGRIASGLAAAHALHVVHGDLKPANILVTAHLVPKILDFGLSRRIHVSLGATPESSAVSDREVSGTPAYMSPEQWKGELTTLSSDIFAFGLIFFELMCGRRALCEERLPKLIARLRNPQFATSLAAEFPEPYRETLIGMLATDPASRPTAESLRLRFREWLEAE
jgi:alkyl hydroperoxide reductase subunit AhpC